MRTLSRILAVMGLAALSHGAVGQGVTQTNDQVNFTFTDVVARVPVRLPVTKAIGLVGPNLICHDPRSALPYDQEDARVNPDARAIPSATAANLRGGLLGQVIGKSASDLTRLLAAVQNAAGREAKARELFGIRDLLAFTRGRVYAYEYALERGQLQMLQMGQEVSPIQMVVDLGPSGGSVPNKVECFTTQQIDQAIVEGTRVVSAIIRAMSTPNLLTPVESTQRRN